MVEETSGGMHKAHLIWITVVAAFAVDLVQALLAKVNFKLPTFGATSTTATGQ